MSSMKSCGCINPAVTIDGYEDSNGNFVKLVYCDSCGRKLSEAIAGRVP